jgi:leader peptidase (prepilin peptidase)/N-methyltransferase
VFSLPAESLDLWPWFALGTGLIVGSFANVCIHRLPLGLSIVSPPSRCPSCGAPIRPWDNVPVLSYLALLGRCRACRAPISIRYPLVEATNGVLYLAAALAFGPTLRAAYTMAFLTALLVLCLIDLDHRILPDKITLPFVAIGVAANGFHLLPAGLAASLAGALGGYLGFLAIALAYRRSRGIDGLGEGDWKMAAMLGASLGWRSLLLVVLAGSLLGTIVGLALIGLGGRSRQYALPFGTFLAIAGALAVFVGDPVLSWYARLLRG